MRVKGDEGHLFGLGQTSCILLRNQEGTSWSSPVSNTCADLQLPTPQQYEPWIRFHTAFLVTFEEISQECSGLDVGATCEVTCSSDYLTQTCRPESWFMRLARIGIFECVDGMGEPSGQVIGKSG